MGPETFMGTEPLDPDFWVPLSAQPARDPGPDRLRDPDADWLLVLGRLALGADSTMLALSMVASRAVVAGSAAPSSRSGRGAWDVSSCRTELRPVIGLVLAIAGWC